MPNLFKWLRKTLGFLVDSLSGRYLAQTSYPCYLLPIYKKSRGDWAKVQMQLCKGIGLRNLFHISCLTHKV